MNDPQARSTTRNFNLWMLVTVLAAAIAALASPASAQTPVSLSSAYNITSGIVTDGTNFSSGGGLDNDGNSYSSNLLGATQIANGMTFKIGPANAADAVSSATIPLPAIQAASLGLLATGINGNQSSQTFTVTYTDGTTTAITQSLSDWLGPQSYSGESTAVSTSYRDSSNGTKDNRTFYLYSYVFSLDGTKTVKSLTLPSNRNVIVLAASIEASNVSPVSLSGAFNREGIVTNGTTFSGGIDNDGSGYSSNLVGASQALEGVALTFGAVNTKNVVSATGQNVALPSGSYNSLLLLATAVNGNQPDQSFVVTYSNGTTSTFTQNLSDWYTPQSYSGETLVKSTAYRDTSNGGENSGTYNLYGYSFPLTSGQTVSSITLPNNPNVEILAMALTGGATSIGDCGQAENGAGTGMVDYLMVYKSSQSIVCVDKTYWVPPNSTAITGFFPYFDAVVAQDKALFPVTTPNTQFVFEVQTPTGGASTGCGFSNLGNGGRYCNSVTGDAFTNVYRDPVSGAPITGFYGYLFALHESVNVFTGLASPGWPTDWWADHRSPFPNTMDAEFMQSIANNNASLSTATKNALAASATAQFERFTDTANPSGEYDSEVAMDVNFFNQYGGFSAYANAFNLAVNVDGLQWPNVSHDTNYTGDDDYSENLSEYVIAYLHLGFGATTNLTSTFTAAGVGTKDTTEPSYALNPGNVEAIANAHCSIRAAANAGVNVSTQLAALRAGDFQNAAATGGTSSSCPSECTYTKNACVAKF